MLIKAQMSICVSFTIYYYIKSLGALLAGALESYQSKKIVSAHSAEIFRVNTNNSKTSALKFLSRK